MAAKKTVMRNLQIVVVLLPCLCIPISSGDSSFYPSKIGSSTPHVYTRFADVERHCQAALSSAAELRDGGADQVPFQMERLSFMNGDWSQDAGQAPLLPPFQEIYADAAAAGPHQQQLQAVNLVSFVLTHVEKAPRRGARTATALNVSGVLTLSITRNCGSSSTEKEQRTLFVLQPGLSKLRVQLEGAYTGTRPSSDALSDDVGGGELVLCMVGGALLPVRGGNSSDPWNWAKKGQGTGQINSVGPPPVTADDNILLVLRYPETRTLTTRAVHGELTSTSPPRSGDSAYFDKVRLVSRLSGFYYRNYKFREDLTSVTATCSEQPPLSPCDDGLYRGAFFCDILRDFIPDDHGLLDVVPNWSCNSTDPEFCSPLGQFETSRRRPAGAGASNAMEAMAFTSSGMAVQGLECVPSGVLPGAITGVRVAAVFRLVPPWEDRPTAAQRTGLGGVTLSAEGAWTDSTGRVCMLACRGSDEIRKKKEKKGKDVCRHRVTMYIPTAFSITRRAIIAGQITSVDGSHAPVSFRQLVDPRYHWQRFDGRGETLRMAYDYTKIKQAVELRLRRNSQSSGFHFRDSFIARSFLSYPDISGAADDEASLSKLGDDLELSFQWSSANKPAFVPEWIQETSFELRILSVDSLVGRYKPPYQPVEYGKRFEQFNSRHRGGENEQEVLLNVSAQIAVPIWRFSNSRALLSLEGVYNPDDGRMHLIGCRDTTLAPWQVSSASRDLLEDGMDCSIEVTVEYPSITTRWLVSPVAKVYITSTRDAGDPLYFHVTELRSLPTMYRYQRTELTEPKVEGFISIAILSATVAATVSQLRHIRSHPKVAPYVSLATLGVQALGYGATLMLDARTLHAWPELVYKSESYYDGRRVQWVVDCAVKALTLAALLLTARLAQKVLRSRARARARPPPSERLVLLYSSTLYMTGMFFILATHFLNGTPRTTLPPPGTYTRIPSAAVVERCIGITKEWFLLPQVVGNAVWRVNCKPLAARYYAGVTAAWLLPHVYGYLRPPVFNEGEAQQRALELEFYSSKAVVVAVPVIGVVLAVAVYVQQRWNYRIGGWAMEGRISCNMSTKVVEDCCSRQFFY